MQYKYADHNTAAVQTVTSQHWCVTQHHGFWLPLRVRVFVYVRRCFVRSWRASPAARGQTATAPEQNYRCTDLEEHTETQRTRHANSGSGTHTAGFPSTEQNTVIRTNTHHFSFTTHLRAHTHTHARTHARTHAHTHTCYSRIHLHACVWQTLLPKHWINDRPILSFYNRYRYRLFACLCTR